MDKPIYESNTIKKGFKNLGTVLLERIINSIANPYKSTMVIKMCKIAKL